MTTIQLRIDESTKKAVKKTLDKLGLDLSSAIKIYLMQIVIKKGIPFPLITENDMTPEQETAILEASEDAKKDKNVTKPMTVKEAVKYLTKL
jgi:DNA-damage-inducible protein J